MIIYQATNSPSRSMFLEGKGENFIPGYIDIAKKLSLAGANILCMSCNTAHYAIEDIQKDIPIKIINLIEEIAKVIIDNLSKSKYFEYKFQWNGEHVTLFCILIKQK